MYIIRPRYENYQIEQRVGNVHNVSETMLVNIDRDWLGKSVQAVYFFRHKSGLLLVNAAKSQLRIYTTFLILSELCQFCAVHSILYRMCCPGRHKTLSSKTFLAMP